VVLDGRLTIRGKPSDTNPAVEGDRDALTELGRRSDAKLMTVLRESLAQEGVSADLYQLPAPPRVRSNQVPSGSTRDAPTTYDITACALGYNSVVYPGQTGWYATWSWWGWTNVRICATWANNYPWGPHGTASAYIGNNIYWDGWHTVYDWAFCPPNTSCNFYYQTAAQWWGFSVQVYNAGPDPMGVTVW